MSSSFPSPFRQSVINHHSAAAHQILAMQSQHSPVHIQPPQFEKSQTTSQSYPEALLQTACALITLIVTSSTILAGAGWDQRCSLPILSNSSTATRRGPFCLTAAAFLGAAYALFSVLILGHKPKSTHGSFKYSNKQQNRHCTDRQTELICLNQPTSLIVLGVCGYV